MVNTLSVRIVSKVIRSQWEAWFSTAHLKCRLPQYVTSRQRMRVSLPIVTPTLRFNFFHLNIEWKWKREKTSHERLYQQANQHYLCTKTLFPLTA